MGSDLDHNLNNQLEVRDARLYIPIKETENTNILVKTSPSKEYCFSKFPGEEHYHLLMHGEIYVTNGHDIYCVECAIRHGFITTDRLNWQHQKR
ncbi:MAG: hypothetical protein K0U86_06180 [Planctomycetes bacterium]|nr:hypothetical protein [Planctomycetota bacterium]MCH9724475.1 hypothetical protein [Planctomycetota bacterium]MCH9774866.1 hypothetical protein [Planctomycetota bacterium]MDF1747049.1 hypothetical protein [Gimesia sp.]